MPKARDMTGVVTKKTLQDGNKKKMFLSPSGQAMEFTT